jgi:phenylpropionate dioxygenase-like ring-hydroxylating dioxygenase large terminal subunit
VNLDEWFSDVPEKVLKHLNMEGYKYCESMDDVDTLVVDGNWILVMEITDDILHIPHVHPAFNKLLKIGSVKWEYFTNGFMQTLEFNRSLIFIDEQELQKKLAKPKYASVLRYVNILRKIIQHRPDLADDPTLHHLYLASLFPGLQIESIPFLKIIQNTTPHTNNSSRQVIEYYYKDGLPEEFEAELIEASVAIFTQLDEEDGWFSKEEQEGVEFLVRFGVNERGPTHPVYETGTQYRHEWIGKKLGLI